MHTGLSDHNGPKEPSVNEAVTDPAALRTGRRGQIVKQVLAVAAIIVQVVLLYYYFVMGLGWGGLGWYANLAQGIIVLVGAGMLIRKRPLLVLPLPVLSFLLMLALQAVDPSLKVTECSPPELSAAAELSPPPGSPPPKFESYPTSGCGAGFHSSLSGKQVLEHYRLVAREAGWQVEEPDQGPVVIEPGEEPPTAAEQEEHTVYLHKETVTALVSFEPAGEEGPLRKQIWVVVGINERNR